MNFVHKFEYEIQISFMLSENFALPFEVFHSFYQEKKNRDQVFDIDSSVF